MQDMLKTTFPLNNGFICGLQRLLKSTKTTLNAALFIFPHRFFIKFWLLVNVPSQSCIEYEGLHKQLLCTIICSLRKSLALRVRRGAQNDGGRKVRTHQQRPTQWNIF